MAQELHSPEPAAQTELLRALRKKIRLQYLLLFFCWFGAICGITALICTAGLPADSVTGAFACVTLIGFMIYLVISEIMQKHLENRIYQMQELHFADETTMCEWRRTDCFYLENLHKLEHERNMQIVLAFIIIPLSIPIILLALANYYGKCRALGLHPGSPACALSSFAARRKSAYTAAALIVLLGSLFLFLFGAMYSFVAHSKVTTINSNARQVYQAAQTYQIELNDSGKDARFQTTIFNLGSPECSSDIYKGILSYDNDIARLNIAVICDEKGTVNGALCAQKEHAITESDLEQLQSFAEQKKKMDSLFHHKDVVGNYTAPSQN